MTDPRTTVERALDRAEFRPITLDGFHRRRQRKVRNQRIAAGLVAAVCIAAVLLVVRTFERAEPPPGPATPTPAVSIALFDSSLTATGRLIAVRPDGSESAVLVDDPFVGDRCPAPIACHVGDDYAWSPDGSRLAFEAGVYTHKLSQWGIYVANADGTEPRLVADCPGPPAPDHLLRRELRVTNRHGRCLDLAWSPDGGRLAFVTDSQGELSVVDLESGNLTSISGCDAGCPVPGLYSGQPSWSPDGNRLAFATPTGGYAIVTLDGSADPVVVPPPTSFGGSAPPSTAPAWSPDGSVILGRDDRLHAVIAIDPGTGEASVLADPKGPGKVGEPRWTPDGRTIVFAQTPTGPFPPSAKLWTADADGSNLRAVYESECCALLDVALSPDGNRIAVSVGFPGEEGAGGVFVMNLDGTYVDRIAEIGVGPTWRPSQPQTPNHSQGGTG